MTPCSLYRLTGHNSTSSTSRSGPAEDTPHPTEPNADAPRPDRDEHDPPTIPANPEGYSGGGLEGIECECCGDGLLECFQGSPVGCVEDSPGFDVGDGALDDLADLVDAPVLLLRLLVEFSFGASCAV